jgi:hypothetical protein
MKAGGEMADDPDHEQSLNDAFPRVRREPRVVAAIMVEVSGFDQDGHFFTEHTATQNVSQSGCCFHLSAALSPDALVALQSAGGEAGLPTRPAFYQVVWMETLDPGALVGAFRTNGEATLHEAIQAASDTRTHKA